MPPPLSINPDLEPVAPAAASPQWHESLDGSGAVRPAWRGVLEGFAALGPEGVRARWATVRRTLRDNGVTYNVYGQRGEHQRPWELDAVPLVLDSTEWDMLDTGIRQRCRLLEAVTRDLYGPQRLLTEGLLPPELVYANANYLPVCRGLLSTEARPLGLVACDLVRGADGVWRVTQDRTQSPTGAGYALENRLLVSRAFPEMYARAQVRRHAPFFQAFRDSLRQQAPGRSAGRQPRLALLTPGPRNETFFEHAYLARYLGVPLVEGGDLTVRDRRLFLKTLGGLEQVDVLLRRQDDAFCDPLELRPDSLLGVAGLVEAVAAGNVSVTNALGSGLVEANALGPFLPTLCERLLGEPLALPSVATWWCGQPSERSHVLANLERLTIRPALPAEPWPSVFGGNLTAAERDRLRARIEALPHRFIGQEPLTPSLAPVWRHDMERGGWSAEPVGLRVFATAVSRGDFAVLPGGLARSSEAADASLLSVQHGAGSKDVWACDTQAVEAFTLLPSSPAAAEPVDRGGHLPSRVGDALFWLGRYLERGDASVHLLRATLRRTLTRGEAEHRPEVPALMDAVRQACGLHDPTASLAATLAAAAAGTQPDSVRSSLAGALRMASVVRDRISLDAWRVIGDAAAAFQDLGTDGAADPALGRLLMVAGGVAPAPHADVVPDAASARAPHAASPTPGHDPAFMSGLLHHLDAVIVPMAAFAGLSSESMTRTDGWRFLDLGRRFERTQQALGWMWHLLLPADDADADRLEALLAAASSTMTYRTRYRATPAAAPVIDLLLLDDTNPRGVAYQLRHIQQHTRDLPEPPSDTEHARAAHALEHQLDRLRHTSPIELAAPVTVHDGGRRRERLASWINSLIAATDAAAEALTRRYLTHASARLEQSR